MCCTACGAEANATCTCGVAYVPKSVQAAEAIATNPEKSDRAIAAELGVGRTTVQRARKEVARDGPPELDERVGRDGKRYSATRPTTTEPISEDKIITAAANGPVFEVTKILRRLSPSGRLQLRRIALQAWSDENLKEDITYF
jgi:hypothetical protein